MDQTLLDDFIRRLRCETRAAISIDGFSDARLIKKFSFSEVAKERMAYLEFAEHEGIAKKIRIIVNFNFDTLIWEFCSHYYDYLDRDIVYDLVSEEFESLIVYETGLEKFFKGRIGCRIDSQQILCVILIEKGSLIEKEIDNETKKYLYLRDSKYIIQESGMLTKSVK